MTEIPDPPRQLDCAACGPLTWLWSPRRQRWVAFVPARAVTDQTVAPYDAGVRHGRRQAAEAIRSRLRELLLAEACCTRRDCPNPACRSVRREAWTLAEAIALAEDRELRSPRDEIREQTEEDEETDRD